MYTHPVQGLAGLRTLDYNTRILDCAQREYKCAYIVVMQHSVTTHSWLDCTLIQVSYLHVEEVYLDYSVRYDRCSMSCLHARGISDLPMGNGPD